MIPLRDTTRSRSFPFVNYVLIALCGGVFVYELSLGDRVQAFFAGYGVIPADLHEAVFLGRFRPGVLASIVTSMFLHGGWAHLVGNMLYLFIFGDNVEDRLGHRAYFFFYLFAGASATLVEVFFHPGSRLPLIGASGAIAGVLGAYFIFFPRARILTMIPLFVYFPVVEVRAFYFLGIWFVIQFFQGFASTGEVSGIAWWAHAGGFLAGIVAVPVFLLIRRISS